MNETEYVLAENLTRARIAYDVIREIVFIGKQDAGKDGQNLRAARRALRPLVDSLFKQVENAHEIS